MAHFLNNKCCKLVCISAIALTSLSSCMKDDITAALQLSCRSNSTILIM